MLNYILPHKSGRCSYRRVFPEKLRPFILGHTRQLKVSLGFPGEPNFLAKYQMAVEEYEKVILRARKQLEGAFDILDGPQIAYLAEVYRSTALEDDNDARWSTDERDLYRQIATDLQRRGIAAGSPWEGREALRWSEKTRETSQSLVTECKRLRAIGDLEGVVEFWRDVGFELAEAEGLVVDTSDAEAIASLCLALNDATISMCEIKLRRLEGENVPTPAIPLPISNDGPAKSPGAFYSLMATYDAYAADQGLSHGVRIEWRRYIQHFIDFLGHDDAVRITANRVRDWRNHLLAEPTKRGAKRQPVRVAMVGGLTDRYAPGPSNCKPEPARSPDGKLRNFCVP